MHRPPMKPDKIAESLESVPLTLLKDWGMEGIIIDVDNTILPRTSDTISPDVKNWVLKAKEQFRIVLVSNNSRKKINRASQPLQLAYIAWALKPIRYFFLKAARKMQVEPTKICVIGDQLFTDIKGAKACKMRAIWVQPLDPGNDMIWTKKRRKKEQFWIQKWSCDFSLKI
jgi:uncharacterized protein